MKKVLENLVNFFREWTTIDNISFFEKRKNGKDYYAIVKARTDREVVFSDRPITVKLGLFKNKNEFILIANTIDFSADSISKKELLEQFDKLIEVYENNDIFYINSFPYVGEPKNRFIVNCSKEVIEIKKIKEEVEKKEEKKMLTETKATTKATTKAPAKKKTTKNKK